MENDDYGVADDKDIARISIIAARYSRCGI